MRQSHDSTELVPYFIRNFGVGPILGEMGNLDACARISIQATRESARSAATGDMS